MVTNWFKRSKIYLCESNKETLRKQLNVPTAKIVAYKKNLKKFGGKLFFKKMNKVLLKMKQRGNIIYFHINNEDLKCKYKTLILINMQKNILKCYYIT